MPALEILITAVDRTQKAFRNIRNSISRFERDVSNTVSRADKAFGRLGSVIKSASGGIQGAISGVEDALSGLGPAGMAAGAAVGALSLALADAVNTAQDFQQAVTNAATVTGKTGAELTKVKENIKAVAEELGKTTVFSAREAANALYIVASAGQDVTHITADELAPALNLAAGMNADLTTTMDTLISTANMFGMEFKDIARISDVVTAAWGNSQANLEKFRYSMKYVGPVAHALNYSLEETTALLMGLYNAGKTGEEAGTTLRGAFSRLLNPTEKVQGVLDDLNVSIYKETEESKKLKEELKAAKEKYDAMKASGAFTRKELKAQRDVIKDLSKQYNDANRGALRPFVDILEDLKKANITTAQAAEIFGDVAGPGIMALMSQGADSIRDFQKKLEDAGGVAERVAKEQLNTFQGQMKLFQSALEGAKIEIGEAVLPALTALLKIVTKLIPPIMEIGGVIWDALKDAFSPLADILKDIAEMFGAVDDEGSALSLTLKMLSLFLKGLLLPTKALLLMLRELIRLLKPILTPALQGLGFVLKSINNLFNKGSKEISANTKELNMTSSSLKTVSANLDETGKKVSLLTILSRGFKVELQILQRVFNTVKEAFVSGINTLISTFGYLKDTAVNAINVIISSIRSLVQIISSSPSAAINVVINAFNFLRDTANAIISELKNIIQSFIDIIMIIPNKIEGVISAFHSMKAAAEAALTTAQKVASMVTKPVKTIVGGITKVITPKKTTAPKTAPTATTKMTGMTGTVSKPVTTVSSAAKTVVNTIGSIASSVAKTVGSIVGGISKALGFQKGGTVPVTGVYYLHKGERVLNPRETKEYEMIKIKTQPTVTKTVNFNFDKIYLSEKYSLSDLEKDMTRDYARGV